MTYTTDSAEALAEALRDAGVGRAYPDFAYEIAQALIASDWMKRRDAEVRAELLSVLAAACDECHGTGQSVQGWTDKRGYSENQYGACRSCAERAALAEEESHDG